MKMSREEILDSVQNIFRDIFDEDDLVITDKTSAENIEEWDSLEHINLVTTIEREFKIRFALGELISLKDVGAMIDLMIEKLGG